jgi:hypothetical protein
MIMGPGWFADAGNVMDRLAAERGRRFTHYLQTNLISYSPMERCDSRDVPILARNIYGLPQHAQKAVQGWRESLHGALDSKGTVAQCDCWVTSYPEYFFGNIFHEPDLTRMLKTSRARRNFVAEGSLLRGLQGCLCPRREPHPKRFAQALGYQY